MSVVLAVLVVGWAQEAGMKSLDFARIALVLALIGLPGATGVAVLIDRSSARRASRARANGQHLARVETQPAPPSPREPRASTIIIRHGPHENRHRASAEPGPESSPEASTHVAGASR